MTREKSAPDVEIVGELKKAHDAIVNEIGKVIIGQRRVIDELLISLLSRGHCLLVGVPGLAKTLLISTLARVLDLKFNRIQFTPDLMPSDITGTEVIEEDKSTGEKAFKFVRGPVFANILLADEINRTPPKTQSALLQAMQEHEVSAAGNTYTLAEPFFVLATQNPIEQEGTYPLPEAQLDRFMFNLWVDYPTLDEEQEIVRSTTSAYSATLNTILNAAQIIDLQDLVRRVPVADHVIDFAVRLARRTRPKADDAPPFVKEWINWGAGPRASQYLVLGAKTRAILDGRPTPDIEDIQAVANPVLRHRIVTNFNAEAEGITSTEIIDKLVGETG
ncbi:MoxR family ATPase [candidate division KSB1 bacterium]|nr:MoxR family ATPase [candidate division KSB1 bacterium]RQW09791.1 MAG: MoxR family ATPase [candidate division KSB1 bacterium]